MGSRNSENSNFMASSSSAQPAFMVALPANSNSFNTQDLFLEGNPGDSTKARQAFEILRNGGSIHSSHGPSNNGSNDTTIVGEESSTPTPLANLQSLKNDFVVVNGVLKLSSSHGDSIHANSSNIHVSIPVNARTVANVPNVNVEPIRTISWKSVLTKNAEIPKASFVENPNVSFNEEATISPPHSF